MNPTNNQVWIALWPVALLVGFGLACGGGGGATFGENSPGNAAYGGGTYLDDARVDGNTPEGVGENGSLAVDPDTELTFTLQKRRVGEIEEKRIVVASPDGASWKLMDATDYVDVRILFPPESVLVMAEPVWSEDAVKSGACLQPEDMEREEYRCGDELIWFDKRGRNLQRQIHTNARYHGTRLSPKRNYLIVADNFYNQADIHLLDLETGATNVVPQDADWFEGMWTHREDMLITAHFSGLVGQRTESFLTIREWFPGSGSRAAMGQSLCFYRDGAEMPEGCDSYAIPGLDPMFFTGFSWIVISPDDRFVAVPAQHEDGTAVVVVVDRERRTLHLVEEAYGPVGFTPDSSTMVAFGWDELVRTDQPYVPIDTVEGEGAHLKLVDLQSFAVSEEPTPGMDTPTFFVSHDSSDVVVVDFGGSSGMMIVDLEQREATRMANPREADAGRRHYAALELANGEPSPGDYEVDREVISASDLKSRTALRQNEDVCEDAICEAAEGRVIRLQEFVSRTGHQELWLLEGGTLLRVDLALGFSEEVRIDGNPQHINILPSRDRLVIDARGEQRLRFFDPAKQRVDAETSIELGWSAL